MSKSMESRTLVTIQISRKEVELADCAGVIQIVNSFIPILLEPNRNRVELVVMGYADDPRALYDIPEVRHYFQRLVDGFPGLFYWLETQGDTLGLVMLMLYPVLREPGWATVSPADRQHFLLRGFSELNDFCAHYGVSNEPSTLAIRPWTGMPALDRELTTPKSIEPPPQKCDLPSAPSDNPPGSSITKESSTPVDFWEFPQGDPAETDRLMEEMGLPKPPRHDPPHLR